MWDTLYDTTQVDTLAASEQMACPVDPLKVRLLDILQRAHIFTLFYRLADRLVICDTV